MKRRAVAALVLGLVSVLAVPAFEASGGVSVFVPESLYSAGDGSLSVETGLGTGMSIGEIASIPIRIAYNQVYGLMPESEALGAQDAPWFYADSLLGSIQLKLRIPITKFYVDVFGGGAANWMPGLKPLTKNIEESVAAVTSGVDRLSFTEFDYDAGLGFGWLAGGGFGVRIDAISVDLSITFITVSSPLEVSGAYYGVPGGSTAETYEGPEDLKLRLRGLTVGVRGGISL